jgi:hypothetical protein
VSLDTRIRLMGVWAWLGTAAAAWLAGSDFYGVAHGDRSLLPVAIILSVMLVFLIWWQFRIQLRHRRRQRLMTEPLLLVVSNLAVDPRLDPVSRREDASIREGDPEWEMLTAPMNDGHSVLAYQDADGSWTTKVLAEDDPIVVLERLRRLSAE